MVSAYLDKDKPRRTEDAVTGNDGLAFRVDCWTRFRRFLILGVESNTIYASQKDILKGNISSLDECLAEDPVRAIKMIVEVSDQGLAYKNEPALFALAKASVHPELLVRKVAREAVIQVARTGTHFLHFLAYRDSMGKWNRSLRGTVEDWFKSKNPESLAYQVLKYPSRDGWSMKDALILGHPKSPTSAYSEIFDYVVHGTLQSMPGPHMHQIIAAEKLRREGAAMGHAKVAQIIIDHRLPREAVPTELLNLPEVWEALLTDMPITAMIRNLGKMTKVGVLSPGSAMASRVVDTIGNLVVLRKGRVHPIQLLAALKIYEQGHGGKGSLSWTPVKSIVNQLDESFYLAFKTITPSNKRIRLAVDVSSSMFGHKILGMDSLCARTGAAVMALVTAATEPNVSVVAYSHKLVDFSMRPSMRLDDVIRQMNRMEFGGTYCSLPIRQALQDRLEFDAFVSYTDSETSDGSRRWGGYYGSLDSSGMTDTCDTLLRQYRQMSGINARHAVVAFAANEVSIANPDDPGQMDFSGMDSSGPQILSEFIAGNL